MPIYEFDCHDCGDSFESLVLSFSKIDGVSCPDCMSNNITKKISTFAVKGDQGSNSMSSFDTSAASCATGST
jgi:putative FmdB family regulatory protein